MPAVHGAPENAPAFPACQLSIARRKILLHFRHASHPWLAKESRITAAWESKHERG
jgi:hypothetical protein